MTSEEFLQWEYHSKDTIDVKRIYIDIAGDIASGVLLSQLIFWHLPAKDGGTKLKVEKEGYMWVRKKREDWWEECRLSPRQFDRSSIILKDLGLVDIQNFTHEGRNTKHIRLLTDNVIKAIEELNAKNKEQNKKKKKLAKKKKKKQEGSDTNEMGSVGNETVSDTIPNGKCESDQEQRQSRLSEDEKSQTTPKNTPETTSAKQTGNPEQDNETYPITDTKPILNNAETIPSDTNPNTDKAEHSKTYFLDKIHNEIQNTKINAKYKEELMAQLKKESFVAGQARSKLIDDMDDKDFCAFYELLSSDETNFLHSDYWHRFGSIEFATEPPKINRSNLRKNHKIKLSRENFYELLDYRDAGFGGKADIVDAYIQHEMKLWDFKKTPLKDAVVFFQKEICLGHPVARHYLNMTPAQRQRELELYAQ